MHRITKGKVRGARTGTLRARCSCGDFQHETAVNSLAGRRRLDRLISVHLVSASHGDIMEALQIATASAIDAPL